MKCPRCSSETARVEEDKANEYYELMGYEKRTHICCGKCNLSKVNTIGSLKLQDWINSQFSEKSA